MCCYQTNFKLRQVDNLECINGKRIDLRKYLFKAEKPYSFQFLDTGINRFVMRILSTVV